MYRCLACGQEYSYGRILIHECGEHSIHHGFLFERERKHYAWNPNTVEKSERVDYKMLKKYTSKDFKNFEQEYLKSEQSCFYQWNCETAVRLHNLHINGKYLNCFLVYE
ncbi:MAG: hypothetical protein ACFE85_13970 [Candidatus Hodarchaeota archaeon]